MTDIKMDMDATFLENIKLAQNIVNNESTDSVSSLGTSRAGEITSEERARMFRWVINNT